MLPTARRSLCFLAAIACIAALALPAAAAPPAVDSPWAGLARWADWVAALWEPRAEPASPKAVTAGDEAWPDMDPNGVTPIALQPDGATTTQSAGNDSEAWPNMDPDG